MFTIIAPIGVGIPTDNLLKMEQHYSATISFRLSIPSSIDDSWKVHTVIAINGQQSITYKMFDETSGSDESSNGGEEVVCKSILATSVDEIFSLSEMAVPFLSKTNAVLESDEDDVEIAIPTAKTTSTLNFASPYFDEFVLAKMMPERLTKMTAMVNNIIKILQYKNHIEKAQAAGTIISDDGIVSDSDSKAEEYRKVVEGNAQRDIERRAEIEKKFSAMLFLTPEGIKRKTKELSEAPLMSKTEFLNMWKMHDTTNTDISEVVTVMTETLIENGASSLRTI